MQCLRNSADRVGPNAGRQGRLEAAAGTRQLGCSQFVGNDCSIGTWRLEVHRADFAEAEVG